MFLLLALAFFAHQDERFWRGCRWGHVDGVYLMLIGLIVEVSLQFLGHFNLFKELKCGVLF